MAMKCSNCGGQLVFDIEQQKLRCPSCNKLTEVENYKTDNSATKESGAGYGYKMDVYRCKQCGGELTAPEEQAVAFCAYCGGQSELYQKSVDMEKPKWIVPFAISKKDIPGYFKKSLSSLCFVPKQFKDPAFMEGFRGIYIPYREVSTEVEHRDLELKGTKSYSSGKYDYYEEYEISAHIGGKMYGGTFDASEAFDDTDASNIAPFNPDDKKPFSTGYLAGFYADRPTADFEAYKPIIEEDLKKAIDSSIESQSNNAKVSDKKVAQEVNIKSIETNLSLFPVWFLTWRRGNRLSYSIMNGQTGKLTVDLPVDYGRFFLFTMIFALVGFAILSILPIFVLPMRLAVYSMGGVFLATAVLNMLVRRIGDKENHTYDYGYAGKDKTKPKQKNKFVSCLTRGLSIMVGILFVGALVSGYEHPSQEHLYMISWGMFLLQLYPSVLLIINSFRVKQKIAILPAILSLLVIYAIIITNNFCGPQDYWYYGMSIGCLAVMFIIDIIIVFYFNYLTTRPVPNFFSRKGADNGK